MEINIGPAPTNWGKDKLKNFYQTVGSHPAVSRVLVGEVACPKREIMDAELFVEIQDLLKKQGKKAVLATYALPTSQKDLEKTQELMELAGEIEVNNYGVFDLWRKNFKAKLVSLGPLANVYNSRSVNYLNQFGIDRLVLPVDLELETIPSLKKAFPGEVEVIIYGHLPCAFSWRCYTARFFGRLTKDCGFKCYETPSLFFNTLDDKLVLMANGPAIYSGRVYCLTRYLPQLAAQGITSFRLEATENIASALDIFEKLIKDEISASEAEQELEKQAPFGLDTNYCVGKEKYNVEASLSLG